MTDRNHIIIPKKCQRLAKRSSASNLHHLSSLQQSSSRGRLSDRSPVEPKKRYYKRSRYQWIGLIRDEIIRKNALTKSSGEIAIKDIIALVQSAKCVPIDNHSNIEELIQAEEVIKILKKQHKYKFSVDQLFSMVAMLVIDGKPLSQLKQKHHSCSQIIHQIENDPETARFKDSSNPNQVTLFNMHSLTSSNSKPNFDCSPFESLRSIPIEPQPSGERWNNQDENQQFQEGQKQQTTLFEEMVKDSCDGLRLLINKECFGRSEKSFVEQLLDYSIYSKNDQIFYGVKIHNLESSPQILKLLNTPQCKKFLGYVEAMRIIKSSFSDFQYIIKPSLKILNISGNNISSIAYLSQCPQLEFLNINNNQLKSLDSIKRHSRLKEIHCSHNSIQVPLPSHKLYQLEIVDLGHNQIKDIKVVECFSNIQSLFILNLTGNPLITTTKNSHPQLSLMFKRIKSFCYPQVYILSEYAQFKDIAFFMDKERQPKNRDENQHVQFG